MREGNVQKQLHLFGGIGLVISKLRALKSFELFDRFLGKRVKQAKYAYADVFLGWILCNLCGAKRLEDIYTENLNGAFSQIPIAKLCSPDSIARIFKRFATPLEQFNSKRADNQVNQNPLMNNLLLEFAKSLNLLSGQENYMLDFDVTHIPCEKADARMTYKQHTGYAPAVSLIGKIPIHIEQRNGNTSPAFEILRTLKEAFSILQQHGINAGSIRMDAASYQKELLHWLDKEGKKFYVRQTNTFFNISEVKIGNWKQVPLHNRTEEITSVKLQPFRSGKMFRIVATRFKKAATKDDIRKWIDFQKQLTSLKIQIEQAEISKSNNLEDLFKKEEQLLNEESIELMEEKEDNGKVNYKKYIYRSIVTNDYVNSELDIVKNYDARGDSENNFRDLLNDFNWRRLPFSNLNENTVFLYVASMTKVLFLYLMREISQRYDKIKEHYKLKKFVAYFVKHIDLIFELRNEKWTVHLLNKKEKFESLQQWAILK
jgi:Transposase DDE domain group 1